MKPILLSIFVLIIGYNSQAQVQPIYIESFKTLAIQEMERTGIPASITLAQGIIESAWGKGVLARSSNNHFGIKCKKEWTGNTHLLEDDDYDVTGNLIKSCFRGYENAEASYIDHSDFLKNSKRYAILFELDPQDYKGWAIGLQSCGYATDSLYAQKLIQKIEDYELFLYDQPQTELVMEAPAYILPTEINEEQQVEHSVAHSINNMGKTAESDQLVIQEVADAPIAETPSTETASQPIKPIGGMTLHSNFGLVPVGTLKR